MNEPTAHAECGYEHGDGTNGAVEEQAAGEPADATGPRGTGDARVDGVLAPLDELRTMPTADHVAVFTQVHRGLTEALGDLEPYSGSPGGEAE